VKREVGIRRKGKGIGTAKLTETVVSTGCHCGGVIGTKLRWGEENLHPPGGGSFGKHLAEAAVGGYPTGNDDALKLKPPRRPQGLLHQNLHHRL